MTFKYILFSISYLILFYTNNNSFSKVNVLFYPLIRCETIYSSYFLSFMYYFNKFKRVSEKNYYLYEKKQSNERKKVEETGPFNWTGHSETGTL